MGYFFLQVSAYFKKCYGTVLCNCGVAVRSADSVFVANFCITTYKGQRKVNRYMKQRLCDDQSLIIEKTSTSYTVSCCLSSLLLKKVLTVVVNNSNNINDQTNRDRRCRDRMVVDLQLYVQSVPIIANIVSSNPAQARWTRYDIM